MDCVNATRTGTIVSVFNETSFPGALIVAHGMIEEGGKLSETRHYHEKVNSKFSSLPVVHIE